MRQMDCFDKETITNVKITGVGSMTGQDSAGQPIYGAGTVKFNSGAAVWQLSASEVLANDRINNPSSHQIVLDPGKLNGNLADSDTCEITLNGIVTQFKMNTPDDIMGLGEVLQFTAIKKVVS